MHRTTPVKNPQNSIADLLTWSEHNTFNSPPSSSRSHQPSDVIKKALFGGEVTDEEVENLMKRKPCSGHKLKEMTGSGIFPEQKTPLSKERTGIRMYQNSTGISQISFREEEGFTPKKPTTVAEVAKQRELSGTMENDSPARFMKHVSNAKGKELNGHDIFAPAPEIVARPVPARTLDVGCGVLEEDEVRTARRICEKKFEDLTGNGIFKDDAPPSAERVLSMAKVREMVGSDIFADGKAVGRDCLGGVRKPPGGGSSVALV